MKAFKSAISKIAYETFNMGQNRFAAQFTQSRKNVVYYLQCTVADEGYVVAKTVRMGKQQIIVLPPPVNANAVDTDDQKIIPEEAVRAITKRKAKLDNALKKGFDTVYDQCSLEMRDKLEASDEWDKVQRMQSLHDLISKIKRICVGFDDYKQKVFNLVQALKTLFLYTQTEKEIVDEYARNFKSLWDTGEAFGGSPGNHITKAEQTAAEEEVVDAVKVATTVKTGG